MLERIRERFITKNQKGRATKTATIITTIALYISALK
jgi:hypothetical protein